MAIAGGRQQTIDTEPMQLSRGNFRRLGGLIPGPLVPLPGVASEICQRQLAANRADGDLEGSFGAQLQHAGVTIVLASLWLAHSNHSAVLQGGDRAGELVETSPINLVDQHLTDPRFVPEAADELRGAGRCNWGWGWRKRSRRKRARNRTRRRALSEDLDHHFINAQIAEDRILMLHGEGLRPTPSEISGDRQGLEKVITTPTDVGQSLVVFNHLNHGLAGEIDGFVVDVPGANAEGLVPELFGLLAIGGRQDIDVIEARPFVLHVDAANRFHHGLESGGKELSGGFASGRNTQAYGDGHGDNQGCEASFHDGDSKSSLCIEFQVNN